MAEAAKALEFTDYYSYGAAVPAEVEFDQPAAAPVIEPAPQILPRERRETVERRSPGISLFAVFGSVFVGILLIFTVLAQISYNEVASEASSLNTQMASLNEQEKRLEITFESVVDMKEVERYARDELGMSKPDAAQIAIIPSEQSDKAQIIDGGSGNENSLKGIGSFLKSLAQYFKR